MENTRVAVAKVCVAFAFLLMGGCSQPDQVSLSSVGVSYQLPAGWKAFDPPTPQQ